MSIPGLLGSVVEELDRDATETRSEEAEQLQPKLNRIAKACTRRLEEAEKRGKSDPKRKDLPSPPHV